MLAPLKTKKPIRFHDIFLTCIADFILEAEPGIPEYQ